MNHVSVFQSYVWTFKTTYRIMSFIIIVFILRICHNHLTSLLLILLLLLLLLGICTCMFACFAFNICQHHVSIPSFLPVHTAPPKPLFLCLQKRTGFTEMSTEQSITRQNKTGHKTSYQPSRKKSVQEYGTRQRRSTPTIKDPTKTPC